MGPAKLRHMRVARRAFTLSWPCSSSLVPAISVGKPAPSQIGMARTTSPAMTRPLQVLAALLHLRVPRGLRRADEVIAQLRHMRVTLHAPARADHHVP